MRIVGVSSDSETPTVPALCRKTKQLQGQQLLPLIMNRIVGNRPLVR